MAAPRAWYCALPVLGNGPTSAINASAVVREVCRDIDRSAATHGSPSHDLSVQASQDSEHGGMPAASSPKDVLATPFAQGLSSPSHSGLVLTTSGSGKTLSSASTALSGRLSSPEGSSCSDTPLLPAVPFSEFLLTPGDITWELDDRGQRVVLGCGRFGTVSGADGCRQQLVVC